MRKTGFIVLGGLAFVLLVLLVIRNGPSEGGETPQTSPPAMTTQAPNSLTVRVIDGDTIEVDGERIRLSGIDAPEDDQVCGIHGANFSCGDAATSKLQELIGQRQVQCVGDDRDRYGRLIAICSVDGRDVGQEMVRSGWAVAFTKYSDKYVQEESEAQRAGRGLWQSTFQSPEQWRKEH